MALRAKVLQIKAGKSELKNLEVHTDVIKEQVSALQPVLQDVYDNRRPKPSEYEDRRDLVRVFNRIAKEIFVNSDDIPVVVEFGSFVMDLFSTSSDLDLSVNFNTSTDSFPREKKIQTLRKFAKKLYALQRQGHVKGVLPVTTARVPILKCIDLGTGVECDISVENRDGIIKSQIIHLISSIDERFHKLSFLMKNWAKAHNINSSKDRTLNSLSIILLVAFHLQTRNPPILPPFSAIFEDGTNPEAVAKSLGKFVDYGRDNKESLAELFVTLLLKLKSVEKLWAKGLCVSTCVGSWISKTWDSKVAWISVEDFTDRSQNVARAVGQAEAKQIHNCIEMSLHYIFSFMNSQMAKDRLRDILFGQDGIPNNIPKNLQQQVTGKGKGKKRKKQEAIMFTHQLKSNPTAIMEQVNVVPIDQLKVIPTAIMKQANVVSVDQLKSNTMAITKSANIVPVDKLKITPMASCSQSRQLEPVSMKRMRADDPRVGKPNMGWAPHVEARVGQPTSYVQQHMRGWPTGGPVLRGPPQASGPGPNVFGWGARPQATWRGWNAPLRPIGPTWGWIQQPGGPGLGATPQASGPGWGGARQASGPGYVRWAGTQQPNRWLEWNQ